MIQHNQRRRGNLWAWGLAAVGLLLAALGVFAWPAVRTFVLVPNLALNRHEWRVLKQVGADPGGRKQALEHADASRPVVLEFLNSSLVAQAMWQVPHSGIYQLELSMDDFGGLLVDGRQALALPRSITDRNIGSTELRLAAGWHLLTVRLYNGPAGGWFTLGARGPGQKAPASIAGQLHYPELGNLQAWYGFVRAAPWLGVAGGLLLMAGVFILARRGSLGLWPGRAALWVWPKAGEAAPEGLGPFLPLWLGLASLALALETGFLLSKASFLDSLGPGQVLLTLAGALALLSLPGLCLWALARLAVAVLGNGPAPRAAARGLLLLAFSAGFWAVVLVHANTFLYTGWGLNLVDLRRLWSWAPPLLGLGLALLALRFSRRPGLAWWRAAGRRAVGVSVVLMALLWVVTLAWTAVVWAGLSEDLDRQPNLQAAGRLPNVIFFAADALDREHLGLYGYRRPTTPNLIRLAKTSTVYTQAFANSAHTRGSVTSILTGVPPLQNRVLYQPDVLTGLASLRHLPGILASLGYYCADLADDVYGCAGAINLLGGFHEQNGVAQPDPRERELLMLRTASSPETMMATELADRLAAVTGYVAGVTRQLSSQRDAWKGMELPDYLGFMSDASRVKRLLGLIASERRPLFVHLHLMKTHGPFYGTLQKRAFSRGEQTEPDQDDFYDDAILTVDHFLGLAVAALKQAGKWDNTLLVFHTDHGRAYERDAHRPVPLLVHRPGQRTGQVVRSSVEYLDLAPTVLAAAGQKPPAWMAGRDLFSGPGPAPDPDRGVYTIAGAGDVRIKGPPLLGVTFAQVISEGLAYSQDLALSRPRFGPVPGWSGPAARPCPESAKKLKRLLAAYLAGYGVDASRLRRGATGEKK